MDFSNTPPMANQAANRIGAARLVRAAYRGIDLSPVREDLRRMAGSPGALMDLAVIEQLLGDRELGLSLQDEALSLHQCFVHHRDGKAPHLRVLVIAAPLDIGGNTPVDFLIKDPGIELTTLYVVPGRPIAPSIPEHDIAVVAIPDEGEGTARLEQLRPLVARWPRPLLNVPKTAGRTDRDGLYATLSAIPNLCIPDTVRLGRQDLAAIGAGDRLPAGLRYPLIVRPTGSHAGQGLERLFSPTDIAPYLQGASRDEFFLSSFVDYSSPDGKFRKYRVVVVDGQPFACHMAIADTWAVWYLNADMFASAERRAEEARFMLHFDDEFGRRHAGALAQLVSRIDLDYFSIDCAETKDGELLIFEASVAALVHDMDPVDVYPYKAPQMRKVFAAFTTMLAERAAAAALAA